MSLEEVLKQYNVDPSIVTPSSLSSTYGKSSDAILAALLKEQGIGPSTPKSLSDQLRTAVRTLHNSLGWKCDLHKLSTHFVNENVVIFATWMKETLHLKKLFSDSPYVHSDNTEDQENEAHEKTNDHDTSTGPPDARLKLVTKRFGSPADTFAEKIQTSHETPKSNNNSFVDNTRRRRDIIQSTHGKRASNCDGTAEAEHTVVQERDPATTKETYTLSVGERTSVPDQAARGDSARPVKIRKFGSVVVKNRAVLITAHHNPVEQRRANNQFRQGGVVLQTRVLVFGAGGVVDHQQQSALDDAEPRQQQPLRRRRRGKGEDDDVPSEEDHASPGAFEADTWGRHRGRDASSRTAHQRGRERHEGHLAIFGVCNSGTWSKPYRQFQP